MKLISPLELNANCQVGHTVIVYGISMEPRSRVTFSLLKSNQILATWNKNTLPSKTVSLSNSDFTTWQAPVSGQETHPGKISDKWQYFVILLSIVSCVIIFDWTSSSYITCFWFVFLFVHKILDLRLDTWHIHAQTHAQKVNCTSVVYQRGIYQKVVKKLWWENTTKVDEQRGCKL